MFKYFLILFLLASTHLPAQEETPTTETEKMVDSILNRFKNNDTTDIDIASEENQEKLIAADEKHMDEFLMIDREREREVANKLKTYLQVLLGSIFIIVTIIVLRNNRKSKVGGR